MASEARDLKNFRSFPGSIVPEKGSYEFPILYKIDKKGNLAQWQIIIRLVKHKKGITRESRDQNWNLMKDDVVPIVDEYLDDANAIPDGTIAQIWAEKGIEDGKITRWPPSYQNAKNADHSNARNALMSAMIYARDKYIGMLEKGYVESKDEAKSDDHKVSSYGMLYPMLAVKFKEHRDDAEFPGVGQPKIDGVHCVIYLQVPPSITKDNVQFNADSEADESDSMLTIHNVHMYSRANKDFPGFTHMRSQILETLIDNYDWKKRESLYLDGELYKHGLLLQQVTSIARDEKKNEDVESYPLEFWLFDCFYPSRTTVYAHDEDAVMSFKDRYSLLESIFEGKPTKVKTYKFDIGKMVHEAETIKKMIEAEKKYSDDTDEDIDVNYRGYEGLREVEQMVNLVKQHDTEHYVDGSDSSGNTLPLSMKVLKWKYFMLVPNTRVESFLQFEFYYLGLLSCGFEGAMFRNINGGYVTNLGSDDSRRSIDLQKHKPTYTAEFRVVGFTSGKGSNAAAVIWVCRVGEKGTKFNVVPKNSNLKERRSIFKKLQKDGYFARKYKGRMYTVEYEDISKSGAPLRAKGIGFRDIE
jgi:hypothetical protein